MKEGVEIEKKERGKGRRIEKTERKEYKKDRNERRERK
jgi:hypothetical protein